MSNARKLTNTRDVKRAIRNCPTANPTADDFGYPCAKLTDVMQELNRVAKRDGRNFEGFCVKPVYVVYPDPDRPERWIEIGESILIEEEVELMRYLMDCPHCIGEDSNAARELSSEYFLSAIEQLRRS